MTNLYDYEAINQEYKNAEEVNAMLLTSIKKEKQEIFSRGIEEGIEKGIEKGKVDVILRSHEMSIPIDTIRKITGISIQRIMKILEEKS